MQSATGLPAVYEMRLQSCLCVEWSDWFDHLTISYDEEGNTLLTGLVRD